MADRLTNFGQIWQSNFPARVLGIRDYIIVVNAVGELNGQDTRALKITIVDYTNRVVPEGNRVRHSITLGPNGLPIEIGGKILLSKRRAIEMARESLEEVRKFYERRSK